MGNKNTTGNNETPSANQTEIDSSKSQLYQCEGFIKEVKIVNKGVSFTLEPAAPYLFEKRQDDGSTERCLLFVDNDKKDISKEGKMAAYFHVAYVVQAKVEFEAKSGCVRTLLFAKANRMRVEVRIIVRDSQFPDKSSINVESFVVL